MSETTTTTKCASCDEATEDHAFYVGRGCIWGVVYDYCEHEGCGGLCEDMGPCECECHVAERATR